jgi:hypothetical protein
MKVGDRVKVYPHGSPGESAIGEVEMLSDNGRAIAVVFGDKPPFFRAKDGYAIHLNLGATLLARRGENGKSLGPWIEVFHEGRYEIEEL